MFSTFKQICKENWEWRSQIFHLAAKDVQKTCRGTVLGWVWLFVKPALYVFVFWFALKIGLRAERVIAGDAPFLLWLITGLFPWFYMQKMIVSGTKVYSQYTYLVKRIRFPLSCISTVFTLSNVVVTLCILIFLIIGCVISGYGLRLTMIQVPFLVLIMMVFFTFLSIFLSPISAISKDISNLITALGTPIFWLSGIIYDVTGKGVIEDILAWNPVTWFVRMFRASICDNYWIWDRMDLLIPFLICFVLTAICAVWSYKHLSRDIGDVL